MPPATPHISRRRSLLLPDPTANALCASCPAFESERMADGRIHRSQYEPGPGGATLAHHEFKPPGAFNSGGRAPGAPGDVQRKIQAFNTHMPGAEDTSYNIAISQEKSVAQFSRPEICAGSGRQTQGNGAMATGDGAGCMARISLEYSCISAFTRASSSCACSCLAFLKPA